MKDFIPPLAALWFVAALLLVDVAPVSWLLMMVVIGLAGLLYWRLA